MTHVRLEDEDLAALRQAVEVIMDWASSSSIDDLAKRKQWITERLMKLLQQAGRPM